MNDNEKNTANAISQFCEFWSKQVIEIGNSFHHLDHQDGCILQNRIIAYLKEYWIPNTFKGLTLSKLQEYIENQINSYEKLTKNPNVEQLSLASKINTYQHILLLMNGGIVLK